MLASPSLALSAALALAQVPPAPAETAAPAETDVEATPAPAPEGPAPATSAPAPNRVAANIPPEPRWRGVGLTISAGIFGAIGLGLNVGRIANALTLCKNFAYDPDTGETVGYDRCAEGGVAASVLAGSAFVSNVAAFGLAAGAGAQHGRWMSYRTAFAGERQAMSGLQIGLGAGLMSAGIIGYLAVRIASFADGLGFLTCGERHPVDVFSEDEAQANAQAAALSSCIRGRWGGYLAGITVTQTASIVGVGLLAHGAAYRRNLKLYKYIARSGIRLAPNLRPGFAGLSLGGRF